MKIQSNTFIIVLVGIAVAFVLGWYSSTKKKEIQQAALNEAANIVAVEGTKYIKEQTDITKNWANQLLNTWKQIWK